MTLHHLLHLAAAGLLSVGFFVMVYGLSRLLWAHKRYY